MFAPALAHSVPVAGLARRSPQSYWGHNRPRPARQRVGTTQSRGFTLVELLVALMVLAIVAVLSWRGLDGMVRVQQQTQARADGVLALQTGLAQWQADLDAIVQLPLRSALDYNGRVLRLTRRAPAGVDGVATEGLVVAAWTRRIDAGQGQWLRWQSAPVVARGELEEAWRRADSWSQNPVDAERAREVAVVPLEQWQVFFFRNDAWTNPLSADTAAVRPPAAGASVPSFVPAPAGSAAGLLPEGVRLVLTLPSDQPIPGALTLDWISPRVGGGKSS